MTAFPKADIQNVRVGNRFYVRYCRKQPFTELNMALF